MPTVGTPQSSSLKARFSGDRTTLTLVVSGRLDMETSDTLWREALHILDASNPIGIVIDARK